MMDVNKSSKKSMKHIKYYRQRKLNSSTTKPEMFLPVLQEIPIQDQTVRKILIAARIEDTKDKLDGMI